MLGLSWVRRRPISVGRILNWRCFLTIGTLSEFSRPYVLRLNRAQPPSTSAPRGGACRFLPPLWIHCHPAFPVATAPKICSTFDVCVSISIFASVCAVVLFSSMFPPHESSSVGVFASRCWNSCANHSVARVRILSGLNSRIAQAVRRIVMTATRTSKARHEILERISDCGGYAAPALLAGSTAGPRPARYWASNARRAAATVGPIPTIPSSTLGPSTAIQSSPRKIN